MRTPASTPKHHVVQQSVIRQAMSLPHTKQVIISVSVHALPPSPDITLPLHERHPTCPSQLPIIQTLNRAAKTPQLGQRVPAKSSASTSHFNLIQLIVSTRRATCAQKPTNTSHQPINITSHQHQLCHPHHNPLRSATIPVPVPHCRTQSRISEFVQSPKLQHTT